MQHPAHACAAGRVVGLILAATLALPAHGATISYTTTQLAGSTWRYDYAVANDTLAAGLEEFTIYFELGAYADLRVLGTPSGWDAVLAQPDPALPDRGFVDWLAAAALLPGATAAGFSIEFSWLGSGTPGSQAFDVFDPANLGTPLQSGVTVAAVRPPTAVPEPATSLLLATSLAALVLLRRRAARSAAPGVVYGGAGPVPVGSEVP